MNVGVIGCGAIATRAHLPAIKSLSSANLYAVADINERKAIRTAKKYGAKKYFKNYLDMINSDSVDTHVVALHGVDYRVVIELWVYDEGLEDFWFGWGNDDEAQCAWNQVWFNVTSPV